MRNLLRVIPTGVGLIVFFVLLLLAGAALDHGVLP